MLEHLSGVLKPGTPLPRVGCWEKVGDVVRMQMAHDGSHLYCLREKEGEKSRLTRLALGGLELSELELAHVAEALG